MLESQIKEVVLLVGGQGAGKTTMCEEKFPEHKRISQDEMGKNQHFLNYLALLNKEEPRIIVDRTNGTRAIREKYLKEARLRGYKTVIAVLTIPFEVHEERIKKQKHRYTYAQRLFGLKSFLKYFEDPTQEEADKIIRFSNNVVPLKRDNYGEKENNNSSRTI